jgi:ubiquinone/menaquinone biosynthesis C-methylase UbiE
MASFLQFLSMVIAQQAGRQKLRRTPEPSQITDAADNVVQYDRVMTTKLAVAYAVGLEVVYRARPESAGGTAVDLACGPGHYTCCLARYLGYETILGIDLSAPMVQLAGHNAAEQGLGGQVRFRVGDVTHLEEISAPVDLASFTDAAHHMPDLPTVNRVLREMARITRPEGLIMVMDLARLRTARLTERYVNVLGQDYVDRGLPQFFQDFRNSMFAAWTVKELRQAIPTDGERSWCHLVPRGLPTVQIILGLPVGRTQLFLRSGLPWEEGQNPVPREMRWEWKMLRRSLALGRRRLVGPGKAAAPATPL